MWRPTGGIFRQMCTQQGGLPRGLQVKVALTITATGYQLCLCDSGMQATGRETAIMRIKHPWTQDRP